MGIYDFFKGECPNCGKQIDEYNGKSIGEIQTKIFHPTNKICFRKFIPGNRVPIPKSQNTIDFSRPVNIGETACCSTKIDAIFDGDVLVKYQITQ